MKKLSVAFSITGIILMLCTTARMFGFLHTIITNDKRWLLTMFSGILVCCIGLLLDSYAIEPVNYYETYRKKQLVTNMCWATICSVIMLVFISFV
jgi:hypothetical protein